MEVMLSRPALVYGIIQYADKIILPYLQDLHILLADTQMSYLICLLVLSRYQNLKTRNMNKGVNGY